MTTGMLVMVVAGLLPVLWVLHQLGKGVTWVLEAVAVIAVVFVTVWLAIKGCWKAARWAVLHWRTTLAVVTVTTWCDLWGWRSLAIATSWAVEVVGVWWLVAWRIDTLASFDAGFRLGVVGSRRRGPRCRRVALPGRLC